MKAAVVTFPGSNCDRDLAVALEQAGAEVVRVWHKDSQLPEGIDLAGVPGGFSYGDYLRCGAIAAHSPIADALRAHADVPLLVSAHDDRPHIEPLLYHSALQHLLDRVYIRLCDADDGRRARLRENLERIQPLLES